MNFAALGALGLLLAFWTPLEPGPQPTAGAVSPDGGHLALRCFVEPHCAGEVCTPQPDLLLLLDASGRPQQSWSREWWSAPLWLPGNRLAAAAADGWRVWDPSGQEVVWEAALQPGPVAAPPAGHWLVAPAAGGLQVTDGRSGLPLGHLPGDAVDALLATPDGRWLVAAAGPSLTLWDPVTQTVAARRGAPPATALVWFDGSPWSLTASGLQQWLLPQLSPGRRLPGLAGPLASDGQRLAAWRESELLLLTPPTSARAVGAVPPADALLWLGDRLLALAASGVSVVEAPR
ncbi:MAG: hypothetical protein IT204_18645 [Fimbriimonadaceae bacterium]|nr:hypothetical protein [Fimbriimonadaceae bacterium]